MYSQTSVLIFKTEQFWARTSSFFFQCTDSMCMSQLPFFLLNICYAKKHEKHPSMNHSPINKNRSCFKERACHCQIKQMHMCQDCFSYFKVDVKKVRIGSTATTEGGTKMLTASNKTWLLFLKKKFSSGIFSHTVWGRQIWEWFLLTHNASKL